MESLSILQRRSLGCGRWEPSIWRDPCYGDKFIRLRGELCRTQSWISFIYFTPNRIAVYSLALAAPPPSPILPPTQRLLQEEGECSNSPQILSLILGNVCCEPVMSTNRSDRQILVSNRRREDVDRCNQLCKNYKIGSDRFTQDLLVIYIPRTE